MWNSQSNAMPPFDNYWQITQLNFKCIKMFSCETFTTLISHPLNHPDQNPCHFKMYLMAFICWAKRRPFKLSCLRARARKPMFGTEFQRARVSKIDSIWHIQVEWIASDDFCFGSFVSRNNIEFPIANKLNWSNRSNRKFFGGIIGHSSHLIQCKYIIYIMCV